MSLYDELKRRNVFRVAIAYLALAWLLIEVAGTLFPAFGIPDWGVRFVVVLFALGFVPAVVISWIYELTPEGIKREKDVAQPASITHLTARRLDVFTIGLIVLALAFILVDRMWLNPGIGQRAAAPAEVVTETSQPSDPELQFAPKSIAVLPFVNMSSDAEQEYFSDGISEELLNLLAKLPDLRVIARTSSFAYKGKDVKIADVARELNVTHVLEGSVRKSGDQVRITAQLIRAADSSHMWSETYDRSLSNIFTVQDEIALAVLEQLKVKLLGISTPEATKTDPEAYALFLQSRHVSSRFTQEAYAKAELLLKEVLAIDSGFAPAWSELAGIYLVQEDFGRPVTESRELAHEAYQRALSLDPSSAPVYAGLSQLARANYDFTAADQYLQKAMQFSKQSAFPFGAAASLSRTFGRFGQSIDLALEAIAIDPVRSVAYANLGYSYYYARRPDEAISSFRKSISLDPDRFRNHFYIGRVLLAQGELEEALSEMQMESGEVFRQAGLAMAYHALGDSEASNLALTDLIAKWSEYAAFQIAEVHAFRGENDAAMEWLHKAMDIRDAGLSVLLGNPVFDNLTSDWRYHSLVEKLGLLPYWQEMTLQRPVEQA